MILADFKRLLKEAMGLDAASIGDTAIDHAVTQRQRDCHQPDRAVYLALVRGSTTELQALIEVVVVPETWFFRDREAFAELDRYTRDCLPTHPGVFRILSLPSSTGEEPYSMAMALLDAGVPAARFRIDAVDISERALAHGRRGVYGKGSFRAADLAFRDRHFTKVASGHAVTERVRQQVDFQQGNLFSPVFLPGTHIYQAIFCRNVLIYFDVPMQERTIAVLSRLLAPTGLLCVGPSETGVLDRKRFVPTAARKAFAFQPATAIVVQPPRAPLVVRLPPVRPPPSVHVVPRSPLTIELACAPPPGLDEAIRLANLSQFTEAAEHCEAHMRTHGPSADAYHLLGLVRDAGGDAPEAIACYRRALYLDPRHEEALAHLALLLETMNQGDEAQLLKARSQRLLRKGA
ncbi:MAG TPA: CheR family methyltransferase [Vicinamibacterales bacterium]|nr:CheR family methyltransferase [Vicinamibacterales bacterium]